MQCPSTRRPVERMGYAHLRLQFDVAFITGGTPLFVILSACDRCHRHAGRPASLVRLPCHPTKESSDVAGSPDQEVLEPDLVLSAIAGLAQAITPDQFALSSLDGIALMHFLLERVGLHFPPSVLK